MHLKGYTTCSGCPTFLTICCKPFKLYFCDDGDYERPRRCHRQFSGPENDGQYYPAEALAGKLYGVREEDLLVSKRRMSSEARNVAIYLQRQLRGSRLDEIGEEFGIRS